MWTYLVSATLSQFFLEKEDIGRGPFKLANDLKQNLKQS